MKIRKDFIFNRDNWTCLMPICLHPCTRAINPNLSRIQSPWMPTIDHIRRVRDQGSNYPANLRAAHYICNNAARSSSVLRHIIPGRLKTMQTPRSKSVKYRVVLLRTNGRPVKDWCGKNNVGLSRYAAKNLIKRLEEKYDQAYYLEMKEM